MDDINVGNISPMILRRSFSCSDMMRNSKDLKLRDAIDNSSIAKSIIYVADLLMINNERLMSSGQPEELPSEREKTIAALRLTIFLDNIKNPFDVRYRKIIRYGMPCFNYC